MEHRRCLAVLLLAILGTMHSQYFVLADGDELLFYKDDTNDTLHAVLIEDVPEHICREPLNPKNAEMACGKLKDPKDRYVCKAKCEDGFEFPNKEKRGKLYCNLTTNKWEPRDKFPNCIKEVVCKPACKNGGICREGNICICPIRYGGSGCEKDKCKDIPPPTNGKISCKDSPDKYECEAECNPEFQFSSGRQKEIFFCSLKTGEWQPKLERLACERVCDPPCENGGTCLAQNRCFCSPEFKGGRCQIDICEPPPAPLNGKLKCSVLLADNNKFSCVADCNTGYTFPSGAVKERLTCDKRNGKWDPHDNLANCVSMCEPGCQNEGICIEKDKCACKPHFEGRWCEKAKCNPPCQNGGTCSAGNICNCPASFTGERCSESKCNPPCQNGGICVDGNVCYCLDPFTGRRCEEIKCNPPCQNGGTCMPGNNCNCPKSFTGRTCEETLCNPACQNGGTCLAGNVCKCPDAFTGRTCEESNAQCSPPCQNGGICVNGNICYCAAPFRGRRCEETQCSPPCQNGGTCVAGNVCKCPASFRGRTCEEKICNPPCQNGGTCLAGNICKCPASFTGRTCAGTQCSPPCQNGGICANGNVCYCLEPFTGGRCEETKCSPPCQNGGKCMAGNICNCPESFTGATCEERKAQSQGCAEGWTEYFNTDHPDTSIIGDDETLERIRESRVVCPGGTIIEIECKANFSGVLIDYRRLNTMGLKCSKLKGMMCSRDIRQNECEDFAVRFLCECPKCSPRCQNGGTCVAENVCKCLPPFIGTTCEETATEPPTPTTTESAPKDPTTTESAPKDPTTTESAPESTPKQPGCSVDDPLETNTCEVSGNTFETFDGFTYQYEICNHVLMKEFVSQLYSVTVHKVCFAENLSSCSRQLVVNVDGMSIRFGPGINAVAIQNTRVPVSSLYLVTRKYPELELKVNGNTLVFRSRKYNFDVTWDQVGNARIKVSKCLTTKVVGLCGWYNENPQDDPRLPDGSLANGNQEFGDSWAIGSLEICKKPKYPEEVIRKSNKTCLILREEPFNACFEPNKINRKIDACMTFVRDCLQKFVKDGGKPISDEEYGKCKCQALESFAEGCQISKERPAPEWRIQHDCAPTCPKGMEWQDCGPGCELTCDNYRQRSTICGKTCVPACYCPSGLVRHQNQCIKPKMCQDCVCRGHGDPNFITFDGRYYAFQGICTYVLAQHQTSEDESKNFRILATNVECPEEPKTSCIQSLKILWNGHVIEKQKNNPVYLDEKQVTPEDSPLTKDGIVITYVESKSTWVHIKPINLVVRYFDLMYGFTIELPSFSYYNKTEGLCGICNFIQSDDLYHRNGYVTNNIEDFAYSWLEGRMTRRNCELETVVVPEPPPGICNFTTSPCDAILDPLPYSQSCNNDVRHSQNPKTSMCRSKFQYAQQCCERGVPLEDWLKLSGCDSSCSHGMVYKCTSACPKTCENYKTYQEDECSITPQNTCVCPEGEVIKNGKCVETLECKECDTQGHIVGDEWKDGPCKTCKCLPDMSIRCIETQCPEPPVCKEDEMIVKLRRGDDVCCSAYKCVPNPRDRPCQKPKLQDCPPGTAYVVHNNSDGCPVYRCVCFQALCPPSVKPFLDVGETLSLGTTNSCCPEFKVRCDHNSCSPPPKCSEGFRISVQRGRCCNKYMCVPQKKFCFYQHQYDIVNGTEKKLPLERHYDRQYPAGSKWQDGLCRKCSCSEVNGQFISSCTTEKCLTPTDFPDSDKYVRVPFPVQGFCCPKYVRKICIDKGIKYEIGEEWASLSRRNCKTISGCELDQTGEAVIKVVTQCDKC